MGSVNLLSTGKSGLFASRSALSTTGHNIANVNTEGYSRQRVEQETNTPAEIGRLNFGTGVRVSDIQRINDQFLNRQINNESRFLGQHQEKDIALSQAENIFNEITNDGLNRLMVRFFNEFRKLGNEPESEALRATVKEQAEQLVGDFNRIARSISDIQKNIDFRLDATVREANELVERIAKLNDEIKVAEIKGGKAADLNDARDLAVKKLSTILDVSISTNEKNELSIALQEGGPLITGNQFIKLSVGPRIADPESGTPEGSLDVRLEGAAQPVVTHKIRSGRMGGLIDARDRILGEAKKRIDELAYMFTSSVNEIHRVGYGLKNATGMNFFKPLGRVNNAAESMAVSDEVKADAGNIATALAPDSPGDNRLVQLIGSLQHQKIMGNGRSTFDDFYNATVSTIATESQKNKHVLEHQTHILGQLEKIRESISGVSLDEETTNLIQYQHAFDASARVIKVADEILNEVINLWSR